MKIFLDSSDIEEIRKVKSYGILEGVTTNPSLIKKSSQKYKIKDMEKYLKELLLICKGIPVSLEVTGTTYKEMVSEGKILFKKFNSISKNVYIKIPINPCLKKECSKNEDGIRAIKTLTKEKIPINCTLIFTPEQAILAAKAGAKFVSPFAGRVDDYLRDKAKIRYKKTDYYPSKGKKKNGKMIEDGGIVSGIDLVKKCVEIFKKQKIKSKVLSASIRNTRQVRESAEVGADIVTLPIKIIEDLLKHPKTEEGMKNFMKDVVPEYKKIMKIK